MTREMDFDSTEERLADSNGLQSVVTENVQGEIRCRNSLQLEQLIDYT